MATRKIDEGYTEFGTGTPAFGSPWFPIGQIGKFFAKFFSTKGAEVIAQQYQQDQQDQFNKTIDNLTPLPEKPKTNLHPLAGDTVMMPDTLLGSIVSPYRKNDHINITQSEYDRKRRYKEFEDMDNYPEISSAFDIYADDCTQTHLDGSDWQIISDDEFAKEEVKELFETINLDRFLWDIIRNVVKYGDCFIELVPDLNNIKKGIQRIKILNPNYLYRVENEYGHTTDFLQEIPLREDWDNFGVQGDVMKNRQVIPLDKNQIIHFRLHTSDPYYYPYGKSVAASARQIYRSLKLMEDAMLIYRLSRAPERRIFYLDVGQLPASKAEMFLEKQKQKFRKEKFYDYGTGNINARYNPMSADEDFFVAVNGNRTGTKIETLKGAENLGETDDVKYFRDKLLAALKIPKDYIVEKDQSPERKANLAQLDVKFARVIARVQKSIEIGLETLAKRHLLIRGFTYFITNKIKIKLPEPSDMAAKRQLDIDEQKVRVVGAVKMLGIFPLEYIYKNYYQMSESEIDDLMSGLKEEATDPIAQMVKTGMPPGMAGPMGAPPMPGGAPPMPPDAGMAGPGPGEAGGQEPAENVPPTTAMESVDNSDIIKLMEDSGCSPQAIEAMNAVLNSKDKITKK